MLNFNSSGYAISSRINWAICPAIERGLRSVIQGIIVHQTFSDSVKATLNGYKVRDAKGAHFLIDRDGTTYQTASISRVTEHVGKLKSRCYETRSCRPAEMKAIAGLRRKNDIDKESQAELDKEPPNRYPSNRDSVGIELVGMAYGPRGSEVYERVPQAQNDSLRWLIRQLEETFKIANDRVYRHPQVSRKTASEAESAQWK